MLPNAAPLHDPELPTNVCAGQGIHESCQGRIDGGEGHASRNPEHDHPGPCRGDVPHTIRKSQVECHQAAVLALTYLGKPIVRHPMETLFLNGGDVVPGGTKGIAEPRRSEVLIELDPHPVPSKGMSMYFSRDISAP